MRIYPVLKITLVAISIVFVSTSAFARSQAFKDNIYNPGQLTPVASTLKVKVGEPAPDFTLPAITGDPVILSQFRGTKNVVLSFVPAAWTPVCSDQWPGYNIVKHIFVQHDAILLGITVDNIPTLFAWTRRMISDGDNMWFPVLSDFWPHGAVADKYGVLRSDGMSERATFVIDKKGVIRYIAVHDINKRPPLEEMVRELGKLQN